MKNILFLRYLSGQIGFNLLFFHQYEGILILFLQKWFFFCFQRKIKKPCEKKFLIFFVQLKKKNNKLVFKKNSSKKQIMKNIGRDISKSNFQKFLLFLSLKEKKTSIYTKLKKKNFQNLIKNNFYCIYEKKVIFMNKKQKKENSLKNGKIFLFRKKAYLYFKKKTKNNFFSFCVINIDLFFYWSKFLVKEVYDNFFKRSSIIQTIHKKIKFKSKSDIWIDFFNPETNSELNFLIHSTKFFSKKKSKNFCFSCSKFFFRFKFAMDNIKCDKIFVKELKKLFKKNIQLK
ncbi:hypothetical protein CMESO_413 (nucleomorph) [Chroomonas mesostigmatica CCMP1168]|uniref:Uncharacterized protein n=1 Tax=Chroomonas mesostigmatica CCMP1168 TaxID=1195612 RepID=J7G678_9CRYP|nr:hypothetical protein CMESO_413 [Chroomonas mesostigmatica CCMP1168]